MSDALFLHPIERAEIGAIITVSGAEARHAAVKRIEIGESILIADGSGTAVRGTVTAASASDVSASVTEVLTAPTPRLRRIAVQALPKADRAELAVSAMTEVGVDEIIAWQASRSIVRWDAQRGAKGLTKWQAAAREATKQSRRFRIPKVSSASTAMIVERIKTVDCALVLHETATTHISGTTIPTRGDLMLIIGPEGGIAPDELSAFVEAGASPVLIADGVLRTSTAGPVALGQLDVIGRLT